MPFARLSSFLSGRCRFVAGTGIGAALGLGWLLAIATPSSPSTQLGLGFCAAVVLACAVYFVGGRAERRRRRHAALVLDRMLDHSAQVVISVDAHGLITSFSVGAVRLFGYTAEEVIGKATLPTIIDAEELFRREEQAGGTLTPFQVILGAARQGEQYDEREWTCRRADNSRFAARLAITGLDEDGGYLIHVTDLTATRRAEAERQEAGLRLTKIAAQVPGMVFQVRELPDGRCCMLYASESAQELTGLDPAQLANDLSPLVSWVYPDDLTRVIETIRAATQAGERWQCEFRVRDPHGKLRWMWANATADRQGDGSLVHYGFIADISERVLAEQAHEENRSVLKSILSSVDLGVFLVDVLPDGVFRFVEVNPAYERLTGMTGDELRGHTPEELVGVIPKEMAACLRASFQRGVESPGPVEFEEPFFVRGRLLWWLTRLTPLRDSTGRVMRLVGRSLDITDRKAVEQRVQSLTERLQLATEAAQVGIWDYDVVQNKLVCDARLLAIYGLSAPVEGTFAAWRDRLHPDDRARVEREYREAIEGRRPYNTSFRIILPNGGEREVTARGHVQRNPAGRAVRMVAAHLDVTAERRAQADIEFARDQAEDLNRQLGEALERAHRLAQDASAATVAKSEFLANMSHEIRTPLNAIIGMSGLLLETEMGKDQREFAETIRSSGDGLLALINDILDYSKIESGRLELEQHPFDLRVCVESAIDVLSGRATEKGLDLIYAIDGSVPESVTGDVVRLRQVLVNLLSNAVKFTSRGEVFVAVTTVPARDTGRVRLRIAVHDSGIGIPADRMDRLFKTFSQVDASTTRQYGGSGLGLAISKRIIDLMQGQIWVESTAGKGSTFCFEIEVASVLAPTKPFAAGRVEALTGRRLLVIDDNATSCRVLCQQAVTWGMVPRAVSSGIEAAAIARTEQFDVMLIDHRLGEEHGDKVAEDLRRLPGLADVPIALMAVPGRSRPARNPAIATTLSKPVKTAALYDVLCSLLQGRTVVGSERSAGAAIAVPQRPLSILVAEDNPVNQRVAILMLQRLGYRADVAANGREAVAAAIRQRYDLILMDVQMPEMDGIQATREILAVRREGQSPRIVAMTANASVGDRATCLGAGMSDFLTKPVRAEDLRRAIEETPNPQLVAVA
ncbi:PAS domain-containing protein [Opitutus sp. ER46]|uniref:PAS domain-containing protein n=1 Tax=Opitutus sp. ER46 TaxID=2161864 RepID=UPI001304F380|nr:PAS domain-containing protein [Opitutus sp. ER46]